MTFFSSSSYIQCWIVGSNTFSGSLCIAIFCSSSYLWCRGSELIHFQEAYAWLFSVPVASSSVGQSEQIHFQETYAWIFSVPLATSSVGESELIHFQES